MEQSPCSKADSPSVEKLTASYGTQTSITAFTKATSSHPISLRFILILSSHLCRVFKVFPFFQVFQLKSSLLSLLYVNSYHPRTIYEAPPSLGSRLGCPLSSVPLGPNTLLSTLFSDTLNVTDPSSHSYRIYSFKRRVEDETSLTEWYETFSVKCYGSAGTTSKYGLPCGFDSQRRLGIFLFTTMSRTALGLTHSPIQWVPGAISWG
jgi:hypothetical protein